MEKRKCRVCGEIKPIDQFYKTRRKNDSDPNKRHTECKSCACARVKRTHDPDRARDRHYRRNYGISLADFNRMVLSQGSRCACCGTDTPGGKHNQWMVDHDHVTGVVRELLCKDCNIVLGLVEDSPEHLKRLLAYIAKHTHESDDRREQDA